MVALGTHPTASRREARRRKKKLQSELKRYFPARFNKTGGERNQLEQYRAYLLAKCAQAVNPTAETDAALSAAFALLVGQYKPACFRGDQHVLIQMEKGYAKLLVTLAECGCPSPDTLTVFQFYTWLESLEEKYEAQKKALEGHAPKRQ